MLCKILISVLSWLALTRTAFGKIEILPLPKEEQTCFDRERIHGDLSQVVGHVVLQKCLYATEMLKNHANISKFPESTLNWFQGLVEQTLHERRRPQEPEYAHVRGKRQSMFVGVPQVGRPQSQGIPTTEQGLGQDFIPGQERQYFRVRKEYRILTDLERNMFHRALQMLKADRSVAPNKFDALGQLHENSVQRGHYGPAFLPWHRLFLLMVENALREKIPSVTIPYWDSTLDSELLDPRSSIIWTPQFLGYGFGYVANGPFANWDSPYGQLLRSFGQEGALFNWTSINSSLSMTHLDDISFPDAKPENNFEEHHVQVHLWVGGFMAPPALAAFDPVFYLLHAYVDLIWELFRNLQRRRGVDPTLDFPMDTNVTGHGYNDTAGLPGGYLMRHGLSDDFTNNIYKYQIPPSCSLDSPDCGSRFIRCDTKKKEPRCVSASIFDPIRMFTPRGLPMDGSSGIRELRSTRRRNRNRQVSKNLNLVPGEIFINGSADLDYANTFVLDGKADHHGWAYIPVNIKYERSHSMAMVNDWCDRNAPKMTISIVSDGLSYRGQYKHVQMVDTKNFKSNVTFTAFIGLRQPNHTKDTEAIVSAYDACGRMCQPSCSHFGTNEAQKCTGALKLTVERPEQYLTLEQRLELDERDPAGRLVAAKSAGFLSFTCNGAITDWIWQ